MCCIDRVKRVIRIYFGGAQGQTNQKDKKVKYSAISSIFVEVTVDLALTFLYDI